MSPFPDSWNQEPDQVVGPDDRLARWARYTLLGNKDLMRRQLVVSIAASFGLFGLGIFLIVSGRPGGVFCAIFGGCGIILLPPMALLLRRRGKL